jgi:hypothetical protein
MQYHVVVPKSQRKWTFKHSQNQPINGSGQGSGNSPHIWTMISSVLLTIFSKGASGAKYKGQDNATIDISSAAFVDDVNTHHSGDSASNTLFENMQHKYI